MFKKENYKGILFFTKDELEDTEELCKMGYQASKVLAWRDRSHKTTFYYHPEKPFVYTIIGWNIGSDDEYYTQLIISREIIDKVGYPKALYLANGIEQTSVFSGNKEYLARVFLPKKAKSILNKYTTANIIDAKSIRHYSDDLKNKGIVYPYSKQHSISVEVNPNMGYLLKIIDKVSLRGLVESNLRSDGYDIKSYCVDYFLATKTFQTELEAWKAADKYQAENYQELRFDVFADYISNHFDIAFKLLVLEKITIENVMRLTLYDMRKDWDKIVRFGLEDTYKKYNIPFIGVDTDVNGSMIADNSNLEEVENFRLR